MAVIQALVLTFRPKIHRVPQRKLKLLILAFLCRFFLTRDGVGLIPELNILRLLSINLSIFFPRKTIERRYDDLLSAMNVCMVLFLSFLSSSALRTPLA